MTMLRHLESMLMCGRNSNFPTVKICFSETKDCNSDLFCLFIITLFKVVVQTLLIANKNQQTKITKYLYNVKEEVPDKVIQKLTHPESISKMLHILGILTDYIETSQLVTIKSQVIGV